MPSRVPYRSILFHWGSLASRVFVGALYAVSGGAKIPEFNRFTVTVAGYVPEQLARVAPFIAAGVIGIEILVGCRLLLGRHAALAARWALGLALMFLAFHAAQILGSSGRTCGCFGILGIRMTSEDGLLLNIVLVLLLLLGLRGGEPEKEERWYINVLPLLLAPMAGLLFIASALQDGRGDPLRSIVHAADPAGKTRLVILLRPEDMHCPLCFDDMLALCDSLAVPERSKSAPPLIVLPNDGSAVWSDATEAQQWVGETGFRGPVILIGSHQFDGITGGKSQAVLVNPFGRIVLRQDFPMGAVSRTELLSLMEEK